MLALILGDKVPLTYVRGGKRVVVEKAKKLVSELNEGNVPDKLKGYSKYTFQVVMSVEELKL